MKRTTKGTAVTVTFINPKTMETSTRTYNTSFSNADKAENQVKTTMFKALKNNDLNGLVPINYETAPCEGKTFELDDALYFRYAHEEEKPGDFYKTFTVYKGYVQYVNLSSDFTARRDVEIPDSMSVYRVGICDYSKEYVYRVHLDATASTEKKMYMSMERFIELSNKYSK